MLLLIHLGICVLGAGMALAGVLAARPYVTRWRVRRRFHRSLSQLELVVMIWEQSVGPRDDDADYDHPDRRYNNPT